MKYDFSLENWASNNSLTKIIQRLSKKASILEFGCANGRLTKFMKENLECDVTIVEIDVEAGKEASSFAIESLLGEVNGNIETFVWSEKLAGKKYDYIIFADVLEHLRNPEEVLKVCKSFLSEKGSVLVSIPNIAHNSIIASLMKNEFEYQKIGLLDDTHIKFYTYNTFKRMLGRLEYVMQYESGTYSKIGENEISVQFSDIPRNVRQNLINRNFGDVYQFVFEFKNMNANNSSIELISDFPQAITSYYESVYYLKQQEDISEYNAIRFHTKGGLQKHIIHIDAEQGVTSVRFDPMNCNCIIQLHKLGISGSDEELSILKTNAEMETDSYYCFSQEDPFIEFSCPSSKDIDVVIEFTIIDFDFEPNTVVQVLTAVIKDKDIKIKADEHNLEHLINEKDSYIDSLIKEKDSYIDTLIKEKDSYIDSLIEEKDSLAKEKDTCIESLLKDKEELIELRNKDLESFKVQAEVLEQNNDDIVKLNSLAHELSDAIEIKDGEIKDLSTKITNHNRKFYHIVKIK